MNEPKGLDVEAIERLVSSELSAAVNFIYGSDYVAAERERNLDYYNGVMADLPAPKGRSKHVEQTVKTYIDMMMPSIARIFFSGRDVGKYSSQDQQANDVCKQINRFINDTVFRRDNNGELVLSGAFKDGLLQKCGIIKAWWEPDQKHTDETYDSLPADQFAMLMQEKLPQGFEPIAHSSEAIIQQSDIGPFQTEVHSVTLRKTVNTSKLKLCGVQPDEFIISQDARTLEDAVLKAHRYSIKVGDLIKRGYDPNIVDELSQYIDTQKNQQGQYIGQSQQQRTRNTVEDPMLREVTAIEGIILCDADGSGLKEYFFVAGGSSSKIKLLEIEPYKCQVVFADFQADYDPHSFWSRCPGDDLAGLQKVTTVLIRQVLDNIYLTNTPQREVVMDNIIKPDQLMNFAPGSSVLVKAMGSIREMSVPFTAQASMEVLSYFDQRAQERTGASKQSAGLDPEALSNQSATAANLAYQASMGRLEHIARMFSVGVRKLFRGMLSIVTEYQDYERIVMLDGQLAKINPAQWKAFSDMDVTINTGLGSGNRDRDFAVLGQILQIQKDTLQLLGPNPAVDLSKISNTVQSMCEAAGIANPSMLYGDIPPGWQPQPTPPQPSPDTVANVQGLVQMEQIKAQTTAQKTMAEIQSNQAIQAAKIAADKEVALTKVSVEREIELLKLGQNQQQIQVEAAKAALDAQHKEDALTQKTDEAKTKPKSQSDDKLAAAIEGMSQTIKEINKPKRIVRDKNGRAMGTETVS